MRREATCGPHGGGRWLRGAGCAGRAGADRMMGPLLQGSASPAAALSARAGRLPRGLAKMFCGAGDGTIQRRCEELGSIGSLEVGKGEREKPGRNAASGRG